MTLTSEQLAVEFWKPVVGFNSWYEVSSVGRVRRAIDSPRIGGTSPGKVLKPWTNSRGYFSVTLSVESIHTKHLIHRLVAFAFIGTDDSSLSVNHKDGNKQNNTPHNLEFMWVGDKTRHGFSTGLINNTGERHGMSKLSNFGARVIKKLTASMVLEQDEIASVFGVSQSTVSLIHSGKRYAGVAR